MVTGFWKGEEAGAVPFRSLLLSILAFSVSLVGATVAPEWAMEKLRADVFPWGKVTASVGIAEFEPGMGSLELLLAAEDHARFRAIAGTRYNAFANRELPLNPSAQRGSLRLESDPDHGFQLVPAPRNDGAGCGGLP